MKKPIVLSVTVALLLLTARFLAPCNAQPPTTDNTPTFYRLVPGVYVNGWPRFTVHYPKDWVERRPMANENYRASVPGPIPFPSLGVMVGYPVPLDKVADAVITAAKSYATEVTLVSDKPSRLRDGTSARELELRMVVNGVPWSFFDVAIRKGEVLIHAVVRSTTGTIGEDLKAIPYSIEFQPEKDKPVQLPADVDEFFRRTGNDILSHDVAKVMANYSDRYLNSGVRKREVEQDLSRWIATVASLKGVTTDFVREGDRAYLTGYTIFNFGTYPNPQISIIKENGEWKWYGNQRDFAP
jgi:hypothetical protein